MNRVLLKEHIDAHTYFEDINPKLGKDNKNIDMFYLPDIIGNRRFIFDDFGYPMNDITRIVQEVDENVKSNLMANLIELPRNESNAGLTDAEIMLSHRSKYCQSSSEMIGWLENQLHERDMKIQAKQMAYEASSAAVANDSSVSESKTD